MKHPVILPWIKHPKLLEIKTYINASNYKSSFQTTLWVFLKRVIPVRLPSFFQAFQAVDRNGTGAVSPAQLRRALDKFCLKLTDQQFQVRGFLSAPFSACISFSFFFTLLSSWQYLSSAFILSVLVCVSMFYVLLPWIIMPSTRPYPSSKHSNYQMNPCEQQFYHPFSVFWHNFWFIEVQTHHTRQESLAACTTWKGRKAFSKPAPRLSCQHAKENIFKQNNLKVNYPILSDTEHFKNLEMCMSSKQSLPGVCHALDVWILGNVQKYHVSIFINIALLGWVTHRLVNGRKGGMKCPSPFLSHFSWSYVSFLPCLWSFNCWLAWWLGASWTCGYESRWLHPVHWVFEALPDAWKLGKWFCSVRCVSNACSVT